MLLELEAYALSSTLCQLHRQTRNSESLLQIALDRFDVALLYTQLQEACDNGDDEYDLKSIANWYMRLGEQYDFGQAFVDHGGNNCVESSLKNDLNEVSSALYDTAINIWNSSALCGDFVRPSAQNVAKSLPQKSQTIASAQLNRWLL